MQRYPIGKVMSINFVLWGISLACATAAKNFSSLAAVRFFLGFFESCVSPGMILITSSWYRREEQTLRIALWVCSNGIIGGPSGLIFYAIAHIHVSTLYLGTTSHL
jgi:ACS family allantoate permease-like MFS transporter